MSGVAYDAGALIAGERNDRRMWALHTGFLAEEVVPTIPAPVIAEAWRDGRRQANLARMLGGCSVEPMSEEQACRVGELAGRADLDDVVDVTVVECAIRRRCSAIVTSNAAHIRQVLDVTRSRINIEVV